MVLQKSRIFFLRTDLLENKYLFLKLTSPEGEDHFLNVKVEKGYFLFSKTPKLLHVL